MDKPRPGEVRAAGPGIAEIHILQNRISKERPIKLHIPKVQPRDSAAGEIRLLSAHPIDPQGVLGMEDHKVIRCQGFRFPVCLQVLLPQGHVTSGSQKGRGVPGIAISAAVHQHTILGGFSQDQNTLSDAVVKAHLVFVLAEEIIFIHQMLFEKGVLLVRQGDDLADLAGFFLHGQLLSLKCLH